MNGNRSMIESTECAQTLAVAAYNSAGDGTSVALDGSTAWMFQVVVGAWTNGSHTITFEHSDDNSSWSTIPADDLDGHDIDNVQRLATGGQTYTIADATKDGRTDMVAYVGGKRYLRATRTGSGANGAVYGVLAWKFGLRYAGRNPMRDNWNTSNTA